MRIVINGFGRIGRLAFREVFENKNMEIAAINDLGDPEMLVHLLKYDSVQRMFAATDDEPFGLNAGHTATAGEGYIIVDGIKIKTFKEADPKNLPWKEMGIDVVL
ncbi:MAG: type I glyceraldehyde-3-phosphate dehydrogenase, partial [Clostridiales bacterium]|nr:type I glyceraldehyde-3-phosphate dehydrogenase [Clostridiales bacterium]